MAGRARRAGRDGILGGAARRALLRVLALVARLRAEVRDLRQRLRAERAARKTAEGESRRLGRRVESQRKEIDRLKAELEEARRAAKRQAAPFARSSRKPKREWKRPGRKPGHPAANRPVPEHIDEEVHVPLTACPDCGGEVDDDVRDLKPQIAIDMPAWIRLLRRFAEHLRRHEHEVFTFLDVPGMEPTNNDSEREIRPGVLIRKISAGNRTLGGAHEHEVLATLTRTAERNGRRLPDLLPRVLSARTPLALPILEHGGQVLPGGEPSWSASISVDPSRQRRRRCGCPRAPRRRPRRSPRSLRRRAERHRVHGRGQEGEPEGRVLPLRGDRRAR